MKDNIMQVVKLFIVCVIAAAVLAWVYGFTKEPIEKSKKSETLDAIKIVVSGMTDQMTIKDSVISLKDDTAKVQSFIVMNPDSTVYAYTIKTYTSLGYGGNITMMVGVDTSFEITGIQPLEYSETPGLGTKMTREEFKSQFLGKSLDNFKFKAQKDGGDIVAITAATITSRAVGDALERGLNTLISNFKTQSDTIKSDSVAIDSAITGEAK
ncbi:MAG: RnfABCDGE type electron transport complex subunit G [bacterium]|nr:RnfABCDGE type electron transport complex subunit G [bacterium]